MNEENPNNSLAEEFRKEFQGKALYNLEKSYYAEVVNYSGEPDHPTEEDLIEFAASRGFIGPNRTSGTGVYYEGLRDYASEEEAEQAYLKAKRKKAEENEEQSAKLSEQNEPLTRESPSLPKTLRENEDEITRLKNELPTANDERAQRLESRIKALEQNRYAFTAHGGPPPIGASNMSDVENPAESDQSGDYEDQKLESPPRISTSEVFKGFTLDPDVMKVLTELEAFSNYSDRGLKVALIPAQSLFLFLAAAGTEANTPKPADLVFLRSLFSNRGAELLRRADLALIRSEEPLTEYPQGKWTQLLEVVEEARSLAEMTTREKTVAMRHLIAALLLYSPDSRPSGAYLELAELGVSLPALARKFLGHIKSTGYGEPWNRWSEALAPLMRSGGAQTEEAEERLKAWDAEFAELRRNSGYRWSTTLDRVLDLLWEEHSQAFKSSLRDTSQRFEPKISPRALFLATLFYSATTNPDAKAREDDRRHTLDKVFRATGLSGERIRQLLGDEFFRPIPTSQQSQVRAVVSDELATVIKRADQIWSSSGGDPYIGTRHLLLALLEAPPGGRTGDLVIRDDDGFERAAIIAGFRDSMSENAWVERYDGNADWEAQFKKLEAELTKPRESGNGPKVEMRNEVGSKDEWDRDAADNEAGLRVDDYATALREVFTKAGQGEFSLAIFGHWGRGKTFLMNRLKKQLEGDKYQTVFFSAWKYPTTPEVWVHLYETIADKVCCGSVWTVLPRIIRTGISKHGPWPIITALAALAFSLTPKLQLIKLVGEGLVDYVRLVGIGGLIWLGMLALGVRRTKAKLSQNYITATRHTEKLGLQATIGRDLKALLNGWMPTGSNQLSWPLICYIGVSLWIAWSAWSWFGLRAGQETVHLWPRVAAAVGPGLFMLLLACWVLRPFGKPGRLLLVIDDLDRCSTEQLLHVVESVKLLTEEAEISKRMQVAALVDEDILEHAVLCKHKDLKEAHCSDKFSARRIIRENCEKLFTAHLRLPPLDRHELEEVFELVVSKDRNAKAKAAEDAKLSALEKAKQNLREANARAQVTEVVTEVVRRPIKPDKRGFHDGDPGEVKTRKLTEVETEARRKAVDEARERLESLKAQDESNQGGKQAASPAKDAPRDSTLTVNFRFGQTEEAVIAAAVIKLSELSESGPWGPRSVRAFIFRYQLARMLATRLCGVDWTPQRICDLFIEFAKPTDARAIEQANANLAKIVQQVA